MAVKNWNISHAPCMIVLTAVILIVNGNLSTVEGRNVSQDVKLGKSKGTIKTISSEDGDIIDCVSIYNQPAFDNPLLKNHKIQDMPMLFNSNLTMPEISQTWHKNGRCPTGTIPIKRTGANDHSVKSPLSNRNGTQGLPLLANIGHEYAVLNSLSGSYYGGQATIYLWNPIPEANEFSLAQIWLVSNTGQYTETMEAGWHVFPGLNGDYRTRFFIYWTRDSYQNTGCYNLRCSGFVQTNPNFLIGGSFSRTSTYGGTQYEFQVTIYKNKASGNWMLVVNNLVVGYWPMRIFNTLATTASLIQWGGEIINKKNAGHHTTTPMGSGHFSYEGFGKASYVRNLRTVDANNFLRFPTNPKPTVTNSFCYDFQLIDVETFYFGGPGYSQACK